MLRRIDPLTAPVCIAISTTITVLQSLYHHVGIIATSIATTSTMSGLQSSSQKSMFSTMSLNPDNRRPPAIRNEIISSLEEPPSQVTSSRSSNLLQLSSAPTTSFTKPEGQLLIRVYGPFSSRQTKVHMYSIVTLIEAIIPEDQIRISMIGLNRFRRILIEDHLMSDSSGLLFACQNDLQPELIQKERHFHDLLHAMRSQRKEWADIVTILRRYSRSSRS